MTLFEVNSVRLSIDPINRSSPSFEFTISSDEFHAVTRSDMPEWDSIFNLNEILCRTEMGRDGHCEFTSFGWWWFQMGQGTLQRAGEVARHV